MLREHMVQELTLRKRLIMIAEEAISDAGGFDGYLVDKEELKRFITYENEVCAKLTSALNTPP